MMIRLLSIPRPAAFAISHRTAAALAGGGRRITIDRSRVSMPPATAARPVSSSAAGLPDDAHLRSERAALTARWSASGHQIAMFFDGLCPLCAFEIGHLRKLPTAHRVCWVDISVARPTIAFPAAPPAAQPSALAGDDCVPLNTRALGKRSPADFMDAMHVWKVDEGRFVVGTDAVRELYRVLGLGFLWRWTGHPLARGAVDRAYNWFAANRHNLGFKRKEIKETETGAHKDSPQ